MESGWCELGGSVLGLCLKALKKVTYAALTCTFVLGGALIGLISGALKGLTTETGFFHGAAIGVVAGAVLSFDVLESCLQGDLLSEVAIFGSLINGKIFREWVSPAMLKAYQWQVNTLEVNDGDISDIFYANRDNGLSPKIIEKLPGFEVASSESINPSREASCVVCLQNFKSGENARRLPVCGHLFHMVCIDRWLLRHGSCPICRHDMLDLPELDMAVPSPTHAVSR